MKRRASAIAVAFGLFVPGVAAAFPVTVLQQSGPVTKRYNIAVLGDGYRSDDQAKLTSDASTLLDDIFDQPPYAAYRGLFNIKLVQAVSVDRGAKGGAAGGDPNTVFSASFSCEGGVSRLLCVDEKAVLAAAARDVPEFDLAVVISNDTKYGGSGGDVPCVSTNRQATEILRHELAHNLANLADEYETPFPGFPACSRTKDCSEPNVTLHNARADIKWLDWIPQATEVPTPEGAHIAGVGLFEGARYLASGIYRPVESSCKMRSLGQPFCPVCSEGLVRAFWNLPNVHLIDDAKPPGDVQASACSGVTLSVATPTLTPSTLTFAWVVDGQPQTSTSASFVLAPRILSDGRHTVAVTVKDATPLVRNDPQGVLQEQHTWVVTVAGCGDASTSVDAGVDVDSSKVDAARAEAGPNDAAEPDRASPDGAPELDATPMPEAASARPDGSIDAAPPSHDGATVGDPTMTDAGGTRSSGRASDDSLQGCSCRLGGASHDSGRAAWLVLACVAALARRNRSSHRDHRATRSALLGH